MKRFKEPAPDVPDVVEEEDFLDDFVFFVGDGLVVVVVAVVELAFVFGLTSIRKPAAFLIRFVPGTGTPTLDVGSLRAASSAAACSSAVSFFLPAFRPKRASETHK